MRISRILILVLFFTTLAYGQRTKIVYNITTKDNKSYQTYSYSTKLKFIKFETFKGNKIELPYYLLDEINYKYKPNKRKNTKFINETLRFIPISKRNGFLMSLITDGNCELYINAGNYIHYWVKRKNEPIATILYMKQILHNNFKKAAIDYFKDCPSLIEKVKSKKFTKKNIKEMVVFYNTECK